MEKKYRSKGTLIAADVSFIRIDGTEEHHMPISGLTQSLDQIPESGETTYMCRKPEGPSRNYEKHTTLRAIGGGGYTGVLGCTGGHIPVRVKILTVEFQPGRKILTWEEFVKNRPQSIEKEEDITLRF
jgi:hypothetical protein